MKHLKKFENFYLNDDNLENDPNRDLDDDNRDKFQGLVSDEEDMESECEPCDDEEGDDRKNWGDDSFEGDGYLDYPRRLEEKKSTKENKEDSGLTAKQKKLPIGLQKAILKKMKSKK